MHEVHKTITTKYYTPSSKPFRINLDGNLFAAAFIHLRKTRNCGATSPRSVPPALPTLAQKVKVYFAGKPVIRPAVSSVLNACKGKTGCLHAGANWSLNATRRNVLSVKECMYIKRPSSEARRWNIIRLQMFKNSLECVVRSCYAQPGGQRPTQDKLTV
jgi:hypothetical protein